MSESAREAADQREHDRLIYEQVHVWLRLNLDMMSKY